MVALLLFSYIWINVLGSIKNATGLLTLLYPTGMWWGLKIVKCFEFLGKKALYECNRFPFVHIASGPTSVMLWYTGSDPECCTCVWLFANINGDTAPTLRSLQCKELTWQPTKYTFCKALSGFFAHQLASFEFEIHQAIRDEDWDLDKTGKKNTDCILRRWAKSVL